MGLSSLHDELHRRISELFPGMSETEAFGPSTAVKDWHTVESLIMRMSGSVNTSEDDLYFFMYKLNSV